MPDCLPDWTQLSLKEQIGQMVVVRASGYLFDRQIRYPAWEPPAAKLRHWLQTLNLGGVILLGGSAVEIAQRSQQLQSWATIPLFIGADIEEGVGQRFAGATWFPPPMAIGAIADRDRDRAKYYATQMGAITAQEALAIGINWIYAPVADVNNNPDNPVINVRSFGDTPEVVAQLITAFIEGAKSYPVLTTAKHFPGHGDTATDSHLDLPVLPHAASRLAEVELLPFQSAIAAGVDSIMSAHLLIPAWDSDRPATLSQPILTGQLRQQLGFAGLIVTDALIMGGVANYASPEDVAVMAVEAGADILLMPGDPEVAIEAVDRAVRSRRLSEARIHESIERIWQAKRKILRNKTEKEALFFISQLEQPAAIQTVDRILRESMQMGGSLPLKPSSEEKGRNLIVVDDLLNCDFLDRHTPAVTIPKQLGYELQLLDQTSLNLVGDDPRKTLLQVFIRANPFRGIAGLTPQARGFYEQLLQGGSIQGLIIYGSPYILEWFRSQLPPELPWIFSYAQIDRAQAIATEVMFEPSKFFISVTKDTFQ
ncbi:beta-glucosidase [Hydrococcus rivularis NIES-593]|uniref:beta-N-acetylhexosaminidase n=1 Tax=Hydrococcus rivularis NIES-593 TaxID=1921803 RepID=A0A1U7HAH6_9CYAN|nr:glycoside hydrolase family 3 N-terminal domain-containing protein [Hydrococcus rivularis]OKH20602.1 beta-glucosidase [Hydrococcus rivularis NIES-593]